MDYRNYLEKCIEKTRKNIRQMGNQMNEYPITNNSGGQYFPQEPKEKIRPLKHIFCWTQGFYAGAAAVAYQASSEKEFS